MIASSLFSRIVDQSRDEANVQVAAAPRGEGVVSTPAGERIENPSCAWSKVLRRRRPLAELT